MNAAVQSPEFYRREELRELLIRRGHRIVRENDISYGYQFILDCDAIATLYDTGTFVPQGRNARLLERSLAGPEGSLELQSRNRILVLACRAYEDAHKLHPSFAKCQLEAQFIDLGEPNLDIELVLAQHRPFTQAAVLFGCRGEFSSGGPFTEAYPLIRGLCGTRGVKVVSRVKLGARGTILAPGTPTLTYSKDNVAAVFPELVSCLATRLDTPTRHNVYKSMSIFNIPRINDSPDEVPF